MAEAVALFGALAPVAFLSGIDSPVVRHSRDHPRSREKRPATRPRHARDTPTPRPQVSGMAANHVDGLASWLGLTELLPGSRLNGTPRPLLQPALATSSHLPPPLITSPCHLLSPPPLASSHHLSPPPTTSRLLLFSLLPPPLASSSSRSSRHRLVRRGAGFSSPLCSWVRRRCDCSATP